MSKIDYLLIGSIRRICDMLTLLSPIILYHHILTLSRLRKNSESALQNLWHPGYVENIIICGTLLTWPTQVSIIFSVGKGPQIYKNWTSNGGDNLGDAEKCQKHSFVNDNAREVIRNPACLYKTLM